MAFHQSARAVQRVDDHLLGFGRRMLHERLDEVLEMGGRGRHHWAFFRASCSRQASDANRNCSLSGSRLARV